jgi:hypothetical protein
MDEKPFSEMPKVRLTRIGPLAPNVRVDLPDRQFDGIEFQPDGNKRYLFTVEVGSAGPAEAHTIIQQVHRTLKGFMPPGTTLVVPCSNGHPVLGIYEITPA